MRAWVFLPGAEKLCSWRAVPAARHDDLLALREEEVRHGDRLVEEAAGVAAQVEDELLHALLLELLPVLRELGRGRVREVLQADVADARLEHEGVRDGVRRDLRARDGHLEGLVEAGPEDRDLDLRALRALELLDDGVDREVVDALPLDAVDDVARADAEAVGGRALDAA